MQTNDTDHWLSIHLILDSFSRAARVLAGELRRTVPELATDTALAQVLPESIWSSSLRAYLQSSARHLAVAGYPDAGPGYAHLLPVLAACGIDPQSDGCRQVVGKLSNEICKLTGRLLLLTAAGAEDALSTGLRVARVSYRSAFGLTGVPQVDADSVSPTEQIGTTRR